MGRSSHASLSEADSGPCAIGKCHVHASAFRLASVHAVSGSTAVISATATGTTRPVGIGKTEVHRTGLCECVRRHKGYYCERHCELRPETCLSAGRGRIGGTPLDASHSPFQRPVGALYGCNGHSRPAGQGLQCAGAVLRVHGPLHVGRHVQSRMLDAKSRDAISADRSKACFGFCRTSLPLAVAELLLGALPLVLLPCGRAQNAARAMLGDTCHRPCGVAREMLRGHVACRRRWQFDAQFGTASSNDSVALRSRVK